MLRNKGTQAEDGIGLRWLGGLVWTAQLQCSDARNADTVCSVFADLHGIGGSRLQQGVEAIRSAPSRCRLKPVGIRRGGPVLVMRRER